MNHHEKLLSVALALAALFFAQGAMAQDLRSVELPDGEKETVEFTLVPGAVTAPDAIVDAIPNHSVIPIRVFSLDRSRVLPWRDPLRDERYWTTTRDRIRQELQSLVAKATPPPTEVALESPQPPPAPPLPVVVLGTALAPAQPIVDTLGVILPAPTFHRPIGETLHKVWQRPEKILPWKW